MLLDVEERLLRDAQKGYLRRRGDGEVRFCLEGRFHAGLPVEAFAVLLECGHEPELVEDGGTQVVDEAPVACPTSS